MCLLRFRVCGRRLSPKHFVIKYPFVSFENNSLSMNVKRKIFLRIEMDLYKRRRVVSRPNSIHKYIKMATNTRSTNTRSTKTKSTNPHTLRKYPLKKKWWKQSRNPTVRTSSSTTVHHRRVLFRP